ncbi:AraC family transcriptional regulator [Poseidonocella sp. HB161398]|uniref:AraC family transcriptional regulator n=1 Tax=Poseidonocella sp. HB161398 TaxID=2320855 RepID=UPI001108E97B|nr:AraC family transcriptional regulator [Poseidonocella sp. HB161398]
MIPDPDTIAALDRFARRLGAGPVPAATGIPGLAIVRAEAPTEMEHIRYRPLVCLVLQGEKEASCAQGTLRFGAGESLIVSHLMPVRSRITRASAPQPYLALAHDIDLDELRALCDRFDGSQVEDARALAPGEADAALAGAMLRLPALAGNPVEQEVMLPLLKREIHYRLLMARNGAMLRRLARPGSAASRISRATGHLDAHAGEPLRVAELAALAGMSVSSFHQHFRDVTGTTPLQYQKELRLVEARRQLQAGQSVTAAAFGVGYGSPTQFSREYARKFGAPPRNDRRPA